MSEQVEVITGALAGIGRATATAFARQGACGRRLRTPYRRGRGVAAELRKLGGRAEFIRADVGSEDNERALVDGVVKTFRGRTWPSTTLASTGVRGRLTHSNRRGLRRRVRHQRARLCSSP